MIHIEDHYQLALHLGFFCGVVCLALVLAILGLRADPPKNKKE